MIVPIDLHVYDLLTFLVFTTPMGTSISSRRITRWRPVHTTLALK